MISFFKPNLNLESLPISLYEWIEKKYADIGISLSKCIADTLLIVSKRYLIIKWIKLDDAYVRRDLWFDQFGKIVPYEITTWFIDQIWSSLALYKALDNSFIDDAMDKLSKWWWTRYSTLTIPQYKLEYELMCRFINDSWVSLLDTFMPCAIDEKVFCYWYPSEEMKDRINIVPWRIWLNAEDKNFQYKFFKDIFFDENFFSLPELYTSNECDFDNLPDWKLVFKKITPKVKWDRMTVFVGTKAQAKKSFKNSYEEWSFLAQSYVNSPIFEWRKIEFKVIQIPDWKWDLQTLSSYCLIDDDPIKWRIINDRYPHWPVVFL